jgi:hypothetical protein
VVWPHGCGTFCCGIRRLLHAPGNVAKSWHGEESAAAAICAFELAVSCRPSESAADGFCGPQDDDERAPLGPARVVAPAVSRYRSLNSKRRSQHSHFSINSLPLDSAHYGCLCERGACEESWWSFIGGSAFFRNVTEFLSGAIEHSNL